MCEEIRDVSVKLHFYLIPSPSFSLKMSGTLSASLCTYSYEKSAKKKKIKLKIWHRSVCCESHALLDSSLFFFSPLPSRNRTYFAP